MALHVPDGDTCWRWMTSHEAGTFAERLSDDRCHRLRHDIDGLIAARGGCPVRRWATVGQGTEAQPRARHPGQSQKTRSTTVCARRVIRR